MLPISRPAPRKYREVVSFAKFKFLKGTKGSLADTFIKWNKRLGAVKNLCHE
jgi:hypothetical protein